MSSVYEDFCFFRPHIDVQRVLRSAHACIGAMKTTRCRNGIQSAWGFCGRNIICNYVK